MLAHLRVDWPLFKHQQYGVGMPFAKTPVFGEACLRELRALCKNNPSVAPSATKDALSR